MSAAELISLLPYLIIASTSLAVMLLLAIRRSRVGTVMLTAAGLVVAIVTAVWIADSEPRQVTSLLVVDSFGLFFTVLMCLAGIAVTLLAYDYWPAEAQLSEEFYLLLLFAVLGSTVLAGSVHFASFFLGLETLSVSLYAMIAYQRTERTPAAPLRDGAADAMLEDSVAVGGEVGLGIEAGIKYLVLAAVSAAFLLFGMALVYMESGSMLFSSLAERAGQPTPLLSVGVVMILVGIGFKLALIPFHLWTPDVYQGAPVPTTAFVASVSKGAMFALLIRFFAQGDILQWPMMTELVVAVAIASMFVGNLLALQQKNIKRILAYSSIAHMGYLLVALVTGGAAGAAAAAFYFVFYFISIIGAFAVVAIVSRDSDDSVDYSNADNEHSQHRAGVLTQYSGLAWRRPWLTAAMSAMLFSLAGIPLTVGFVGKFYLLTAGVGAGHWALVISLVLSSVIGLYYYLRVIVIMFGEDEHLAGNESQPSSVSQWRTSPCSSIVTLVVLCVLLVWLGVYPAPMIQWVQNIAVGL